MGWNGNMKREIFNTRVGALNILKGVKARNWKREDIRLKALSLNLMCAEILIFATLLKTLIIPNAAHKQHVRFFP